MQQPTGPVPQTVNQKSHDQNQNARDQPDSARLPDASSKKMDNGTKTEKLTQTKPKTPLEMIEEILGGCKELEDRVMNFSGTKKDKEYKFLEEMLTRSILKLDGIESGADDNIRQSRKKAVREIQSFLDQLELKAFSESVSASVQSMDTSQTEKSNTVDSSNGSMDTSQTDSVQNRTGGGAETDTADDRKVKEMVLDSEVAC